MKQDVPIYAPYLFRDTILEISASLSDICQLNLIKTELSTDNTNMIDIGGFKLLLWDPQHETEIIPRHYVFPFINVGILFVKVNMVLQSTAIPALILLLFLIVPLNFMYCRSTFIVNKGSRGRDL